MKLKLFAVTIVSSLLLVACSGENKEEATLTVGYETQNIKELVNDYTTDQLTAKNASINSQQLIVTESDGSETVYDLPEDEFFVSIAPYVNETHPCEIHSLTGCQGEMVEQDVQVTIADTEGNIIIDETMTTQANGFIDLWLPRNEKYEVKIEQDSKIAESEISTFDDDQTCITTMQLL